MIFVIISFIQCLKLEYADHRDNLSYNILQSWLALRKKTYQNTIYHYDCWGLISKRQCRSNLY